MTEQPAPTEQEVEALTSVKAFKDRYNKVLVELDALYRGTFDETEADNAAALCLLAQAPLARLLAEAEFRARTLKRDIEFAKADAWVKMKTDPPGGKKVAVTEAPIILNKDEEIQRLSREQNQAEKEARELSTILALLKDAHITFRLVKRSANA